MKLVLFSGTHSRHLFVNKEVVKYFDDVLVIVMEREDLLPEPPKGLAQRDEELFRQHFMNRKIVEDATYGELRASEVFAKSEIIYISQDQLNSEETAKRVRDFEPDFCFIFGTDLILEPVFDVLPTDKVNLHLGLSPWYKGAATLYWPFYLLQPQWCGVTFHQISRQPDAGEIIHQCVPELARGDRIHEVAAKCVVKAAEDLPRLLDHWLKTQKFVGKSQQTSGRNWRASEFHASQLRVIYDQFDDDIVDAYIDGELGQRKPNLFSCLDKYKYMAQPVPMIGSHAN